MENSLSVGAKPPWEFLVARIIAAYMAFINIATLLGSVARLIRGPHTFLSVFYAVLGLAMAALTLATVYWTFRRLRHAIGGYAVLIVLVAAKMLLFPRLPESRNVVLVEVSLACAGLVVYVIPLILLVRVRGILRP